MREWYGATSTNARLDGLARSSMSTTEMCVSERLTIIRRAVPWCVNTTVRFTAPCGCNTVPQFSSTRWFSSSWVESYFDRSHDIRPTAAWGRYHHHASPSVELTRL